MNAATFRELPMRFLEKMEVDSATACWNWTASKVDGYGRFWSLGRYVMAHRFAYESLVSAIPKGLVIDHLCRNRRCVNPEHLRAVTQRENILAPGSRCPNVANSQKTHCPSGHPYSPENTRHDGRGRVCRSCDRLRPRRSSPAVGYWYENGVQS